MPKSFWDSLVPKYRPAPGQKELPPVPSGPMPDKGNIYTLPKNPTIAENPTVAALAAFVDTYIPEIPKSVDDVLLDALSLSPAGAALGSAAKGVATAAGFVPPKYIKGMADALTRRIDSNPSFPGKQIALDASQQFPTSSAHLSNVRGMTAADAIRLKDLNVANKYQGLHALIPELDPAKRTAIRNNPDRHKLLEEIIETPNYRDMDPATQQYYDDYKNFGKILISPRAGSPEMLARAGSIEELIPHEFAHVGQSSLNRIKESWRKLPNIISPHEIGARVTGRMRANPEAGLNYNSEVLKELNKFASTPARKSQWDEILEVFNERMEKSGKQIVPVPNTPTPSGLYVGQKLNARSSGPPVSRPYRRFEIKSLTTPDDPDRYIITP